MSMTGMELQPVQSAAPIETGSNEGFALTPVWTIDAFRKHLQEIRKFIAEVMVPGQDYGMIPGADKPTLHKPGAELLAEFYGLAPTYVVMNRIERWEEPGFFAYEFLCRLIHKRTGVVVAEGVGSCNSLESRYRYRWVPESQLPPRFDKQNAVTRRGRNGLLLYRVENDDFFSLANTILKMAKKRALVDAVLSATRSSGIFTQDLEDIGVAPDDELPPVEQAPATVPAAPASGGNGAANGRRTVSAPRPRGVRPSIDWSGFWKAAKGELGLSEDEVHREAAAFFSRDELKSLTEVIKSQDDLDRFLEHLRGGGAQDTEVYEP